MQPDERVLSSCDVTGLVKNSLSLCVRSAPFNTSISHSRYRCRCRTCNLMVITSPRKSSNRLFWSTTRIVRSVMLRAVIGKNDNAPPRFAVGSIRFFAIFVVFSLIVFFGFMPMPILILIFIPAQTAAAALKVESLAVTRLCDKQDAVREYFSMGRHANVDCFYLCQTYARIPKHLIRDNANLLILFKQNGTNLKHVYNDHVNTDMSYDELYALCRDCWQQKYGFVVIDKDSALTNGRYRKEFNEFAIP
ncbi:hypothetical protein ALC57_07575 [Trachymyrmex cornetzi]|uniref:Uncharacterized protein n=1 Tax=Trachymyrmex cornetzi TaxID=471704 RepID=A0A151J7T4_9HYME|nr:hypothetical protein ALC57_07575 [Trachymyrmex cornetzi]